MVQIMSESGHTSRIRAERGSLDGKPESPKATGGDGSCGGDDDEEYDEYGNGFLHAERENNNNISDSDKDWGVEDPWTATSAYVSPQYGDKSNDIDDAPQDLNLEESGIIALDSEHEILEEGPKPCKIKTHKRRSRRSTGSSRGSRVSTNSGEFQSQSFPFFQTRRDSADSDSQFSATSVKPFVDDIDENDAGENSHTNDSDVEDECPEEDNELVANTKTNTCKICKLKFDSYNRWKKHAVYEHILRKDPYPIVEMNFVNTDEVRRRVSQEGVEEGEFEDESVFESQEEDIDQGYSETVQSESVNHSSRHLRLCIGIEKGAYVVKSNSVSSFDDSSPPPLEVAPTPLPHFLESSLISKPVVMPTLTPCPAVAATLPPVPTNEESAEEDLMLEPIVTMDLEAPARRMVSIETELASDFNLDREELAALELATEMSRVAQMNAKQSMLPAVGGGNISVTTSTNVSTPSTSATDCGDMISEEAPNHLLVTLAADNADGKELISTSCRMIPSINHAESTVGLPMDGTIPIHKQIQGSISTDASPTTGTSESDLSNSTGSHNMTTKDNGPMGASDLGSCTLSNGGKDSEPRVEKTNGNLSESETSVTNEIVGESATEMMDRNNANTSTNEGKAESPLIHESGSPIGNPDSDDFECQVCHQNFTSDETLNEHFSEEHFRLAQGTGILEPESPYPATPLRAAHNIGEEDADLALPSGSQMSVHNVEEKHNRPEQRISSGSCPTVIRAPVVNLQGTRPQAVWGHHVPTGVRYPPLSNSSVRAVGSYPSPRYVGPVVSSAPIYRQPPHRFLLRPIGVPRVSNQSIPLQMTDRSPGQPRTQFQGNMVSVPQRVSPQQQPNYSMSLHNALTTGSPPNYVQNLHSGVPRMSSRFPPGQIPHSQPSATATATQVQYRLSQPTPHSQLQPRLVGPPARVPLSQQAIGELYAQRELQRYLSPQQHSLPSMPRLHQTQSSQRPITQAMGIRPVPILQKRPPPPLGRTEIRDIRPSKEACLEIRQVAQVQPISANNNPSTTESTTRVNTVKLGDSVTLSVCSPSVGNSANNKTVMSPATSPGQKERITHHTGDPAGPSNNLSSVLALRGVSITSSPPVPSHSPISNPSPSNSPGTGTQHPSKQPSVIQRGPRSLSPSTSHVESQQDRNFSPPVITTVRGGVHPAMMINRGADTHHFLVPRLPPPTNRSPLNVVMMNVDAERPDRPPTVDLTQDDGHSRFYTSDTYRMVETRPQLSPNQVHRSVPMPQPHPSYPLPRQTRPLVCNLCGVVCPSIQVLEEHKLASHIRESSSSSASSISGYNNNNPNPPAPRLSSQPTAIRSGMLPRHMSPGHVMQHPHQSVRPPPIPPGVSHVRNQSPVTQPQSQSPHRPNLPNSPSTNQAKYLYIPLLDLNRIDASKMRKLEEIGIHCVVPLQGNSSLSQMGIPIMNLRIENSGGQHLPWDSVLPMGPVHYTSVVEHRNRSNPNVSSQQHPAPQNINNNNNSGARNM